MNPNPEPPMNCPHCGNAINVAPKRHRVVAVGKTLEVDNRAELREHVLAGADQNPFVVLDFSGTTYVDSSGLGMMCSASKKLREKGGELRVANPCEDLRVLFELTHLRNWFPELSETP